ncbi:MAG: hypothetical protein AVDCRST_MAG58-2162 [uncultured Rubrobacteraceae bacterium]|uniref:Uncharacterized protein n=1 Tax=uncultured Rubrobacteraceae bacterium TaxID=349277 RepID=A0A6J4R0N8_9ACTN|nr:MAG: hypothetical protein AVDCRST_MAG58-2162 [uncultured Rubrobacteraceae bacterium]
MAFACQLVSFLFLLDSWQRFQRRFDLLALLYSDSQRYPDAANYAFGYERQQAEVLTSEGEA